MQSGIDPKVDFAFKKVFGSESNVDLLQSLLEAVLDLPAGSLPSIEITNPFNDRDTADDKLSILDIKARDSKQRWYNIEMQCIAHEALRERVLYYWARVYSQQLGDGE